MSTNKVNLLFIVLLLFSGEIYAQEHIRLSQYFQNLQFYNPAFSGIENYLDVKIAHKQNVGAYEFAPQTTFISASAPFNASSRKATELYSLRISNPKVYSNLSKGSVQPLKHGIGGTVLSEKQDAFNQQSAMITYAFHFKVNKNINISGGVSPFIYRNRVDVNKIRLEQDDEIVDPVKGNYQVNNLLISRFGLNSGILLYSENFHLGYSASGILQSELKKKEEINGRNALLEKKISHSVMAGYRVDLQSNLVFFPGFYINYQNNLPILYNINARVKYENKYWGGLGYATSGNLSIMAGMKLSDWININYSYDYTIKGVSNYLSGSHELVIGFMLIRNGSNRSITW